MKKNFDLWVHSHPALKRLINGLIILILIIVAGVSNVLAASVYSPGASFPTGTETYISSNLSGSNDLLTAGTFGSTGLTSETESQQIKISGKVTDAATKESMPGVNVLVKGTTFGVLTDVNGNYSVTAPDKNSILVFSFIGYGSIELPVSGRSVVDVELVAEVLSLDEVVVVGYGTVKKTTVTGSISTVTGRNLQSSPSINFTNTLTGRLSGITAVQRSGEPGLDATTITIRGVNTLGNNSPLIVIDGIANRSMSGLNSADIESITILKDASAAIYGAQAANGVILITTKRGTAGKMQVDVYFLIRVGIHLQ